jgi:cyanobactin biosynthesis protein (PatB/AcyB/McaB family)
MKLPLLSPPVRRPDLVKPHETVDVVQGDVDSLVSIRIHLLHGANYNDPAGFQNRSFNQMKSSGGCGCF